MPRNAAAAFKDADWHESLSQEEIERRRQILSEIRALRSHPATEEEREFWRKFDAEVRGPQPPLNAPVTEEEMEHRRRIVARLRARMAKPATEEDQRIWEEFMKL
jgi:hypothetical protein